MQQVVYSANAFRARQAEAFSHVDAGDRVIIRPRNRRRSYMITAIDDEDLVPSPEFLAKIEEAMAEAERGECLTFTDSAELRKWLESL